MIRSLVPVSALSLALVVAACSAGADKAEAPLPEGAWQLAADQSNVGFVSVKAGNVGEAHSFKKLSGSVEPDGTVAVAIDLASVDTGIDIRNQRMRDMLFEVANFPDAKLTAKIDPNAIKALKPGERKTIAVPVTLDLHGTTNAIEAPLTSLNARQTRLLRGRQDPALQRAARQPVARLDRQDGPPVVREQRLRRLEEGVTFRRRASPNIAVEERVGGDDDVEGAAQPSVEFAAPAQHRRLGRAPRRRVRREVGPE